MSRQVMQQALEALEWNYNTDLDNIHACEQWAKILKKNIAALRERLKQSQPMKFNCTVVDDDHPEGVLLSQWGQQQKQKPFCYHDGRNIVGKEYAHHCDVFPLYTEPQPEQEPLTDEEIDVLILDSDGLPKSHLEFARDIEAAHGITGDANEN